MTAFVAVAALLVAAALLFVLWPLLRTRAIPHASRESANLSIYRDQFAELERDLRLGTLDSTQYEAARAELQRRLLDEVPAAPAATSRVAASGRLVALAIGIGLPVAAGLLYWRLGQPEGIGAPKHAAQEPSSITREQFEAMTQQLAQRLAASPNDPVGWLMLGRAYGGLERHPEAAKALAEANRRKPGDPEILVEYARALAQVGGGKLSGEPTRLLEQALAVAPNDQRALTLAGGAAFEAHDYPKAIRYWERLVAQVPADSELAKALAVGLQRARALAQDGSKAPAGTAPGGGAVLGNVSLAATLKNRASPDDTVFIFARAAEGPRIPLAVTRKQVKDLPVEFRLDDSMAMNPELKLSAFSRVVVSARVSRSGSAMPQSGDLQGETAPLSLGGAGKVSVVIDRVVP